MSGLWMTTLPWLLGSLGVVIALALLRRPLGTFFRLAGRTGAGLGVNLFNALVLGLLGIPGFGLLMMLNWVLR